jgi:TM2 domain-containing membrane protein YozV
MFWTITVVLLAFWLLGYIGQVGEGFIHLLLFVAVIVMIYHLVTRRRVV